MGNGFLTYLHNIVPISLIIVITHYLLRFIKLLFGQVERGKIRFMEFYQEWAKPTYQICSFILIAVTAAIIFPYLPGYQSLAFHGISVFIGVLISLGSTSITANTNAGIILLYAHSFQLGDYVQIEEVVGHVEDKNPFVIRICTPKIVLVVLPNATILNSKVTNFSLSARDTGIPLILHTPITLGYDVPWRKIHKALIQAARDCPSIVQDCTPFVLQTSLDDFYVSYQLNAYTHQTSDIPGIHSQLYKNIQDRCDEVDIKIMSPHYNYTALRDGNPTTIPENYLPKDYRSPRFGIRLGTEDT